MQTVSKNLSRGVLVADWRNGGFGIYIHWPFCAAKCPYCDFNSHVADAVDQDAWRAGLLAELDHYGTKTKRRRLDSVFFGGGTPSLMPAETAAAIVNALPDYWDVPADVESLLVCPQNDPLCPAAVGSV